MKDNCKKNQYTFVQDISVIESLPTENIQVFSINKSNKLTDWKVYESLGIGLLNYPVPIIFKKYYKIYG